VLICYFSIVDDSLKFGEQQIMSTQKQKCNV